MRYIAALQRSQTVGASAALRAGGTVVFSGVMARAEKASGNGVRALFPSSSDMRGNYGMACRSTLETGASTGMTDGWIDEQLVARGIADARVLDAMRRVPRDRFVPDAARRDAYGDRALPIGAGQTISQPYMVAAMTEALHLTGRERVLDVGTGSGYQAAILAELAHQVTSIERVNELAAEAARRLASLGYTNVDVLVGDGTLGVPDRAPFDAILVAAGAPRVPDALKDQLSRGGGRLVIPVGGAAQQWLTTITRDGDRFSESTGVGCVFVPLLGAQGW